MSFEAQLFMDTTLKMETHSTTQYQKMSVVFTFLIVQNVGKDWVYMMQKPLVKFMNTMRKRIGKKGSV